jgi:hypothetical protein
VRCERDERRREWQELANGLPHEDVPLNFSRAPILAHSPHFGE